MTQATPEPYGAYGHFGVFSPSPVTSPQLAAELEQLGFRTLWLGRSSGDLKLVEDILEATTSLRVATGIVNIWRDSAPAVAESYHRISASFPGRFTLGIGVGHPEGIGARYSQPYRAMVDYLDILDDAAVPKECRVIAALGPRMLTLAAERSLGAHPYLVTPAHTRLARQLLGPEALLAPEQAFIVGTERGDVRARAGRFVSDYLQMKNYTNNLLTLGFAEADLEGSGSDRLVDALVLNGSAASVATALSRHLDAGANHVAIQLVTDSLGQDRIRGYGAIAEELFG